MGSRQAKPGAGIEMGAVPFKRQRITKYFIALAVRVYNVCLRCYPPNFREDYQAEMRTVFKQSLQEAENTNWRAPCSRLLRELYDYPACLLQAHLAEMRRKEAVMSLDGDFINRELLLRPADDGNPGTRQDALLAALPMVAVGLYGGGMGFLAATTPGASNGWQVFVRVLEIGSAILLVLSMLGMTILAWRRGWPRWFAPWMPFWLVPVLALINWPLQALELYWIQNVLLYIQFPLALAIVIVAAW